MPPGSETPQAIFAANVARMRKERGLTQEKLGWASGLHASEVGRIEKGTRNPGVETVFKLAAGLQVAPADLFEGID